MIYGYCRISTPKQSIERQVRNILDAYAGKKLSIVQEAYTGKTMSRPEWLKLRKRLKDGDLLVFDSVSRMSRDADEGIKTYFELMESGVELAFLKEPYINTEVYQAAVSQTINATGNEIADIYIDATNKVIKLLAEKQIRKAFEQSEKEACDIRQRTKEGLQTAKMNGKKVGGHEPGVKLNSKKKVAGKEVIKKHSRTFGGSLSDGDCIKLIGCCRNAYYSWKRELMEEIQVEGA